MMEHDQEPVPGLPAALPEGEVVLWQGAPDWRSLAVHAFHLRAIGLYFFALTVWSVVSALYDGYPGPRAFAFALWPIALGLVAGGLVVLFARATARATLYTLTTRRLVMRVGVALSVTINVPYRLVASAALRRFRDGTGDIPLVVAPPHRVSYVMAWPHVRGLRMLRPQPTLRAVPDASRVAEILTQALAGHATAPLAARSAEPAGTAVPGRTVAAGGGTPPLVAAAS